MPRPIAEARAEGRLLKSLRERLNFRQAAAAVAAIGTVYEPGMSDDELADALRDTVGSPAWLPILIELLPALWPLIKRLFG